MTFQNRLKELRIKNNLTQQEVSTLIGVSKSTYIKYERGEREPKYIMLINIAKKYDVSIDYLLGKSDEENKYIYTINKAAKLATDKTLISSFGEYSEAITRMSARYSSYLYNLDYNCLIDLFYMTIQVQDAMEDIYAKGLNIFCYEEMKLEDVDFIPPPSEATYRELNEKIGNFRKLVDEYIYLLQSPEFYKTEDNNYYFGKAILEFGQK